MNRPRILLAEDQSQVLKFLRVFPEQICNNVVGAVRDEDALIAAAKALEPDILFIDIDLPRLNGIDATRQLRRIVPNSLIILKSCHAAAERVAEAYAAGASVYLIKGPSTNLTLTVRALIEQHRETYDWKMTPPAESPNLNTHLRSVG